MFTIVHSIFLTSILHYFIIAADESRPNDNHNKDVYNSNNNNNKCIIIEEILISTFVCDLMFLYDHYTPKNTSKTSLILNILNENQHFQIIDNHQLVTRGRIDREHYVFEKLCQNIQKNNNMIMNFDEDYSLLNEGEFFVVVFNLFFCMCFHAYVCACVCVCVDKLNFNFIL